MPPPSRCLLRQEPDDEEEVGGDGEEDDDRIRMNVYVIDGTYELFRHFYAMPATADVNGQEVGAVRGVMISVLSMIERGATHIWGRNRSCR